MRALALWMAAGSLSAHLAALGAPPVTSIRVVPAATELLVGEPLILIATFEGDGPALLAAGDGPVAILIDRGSGFEPCREPVFGHSDFEAAAPEPIPGRRATREYLVTYDANIGDWAFPVPGTYQVLVRYADEENEPVESSPVDVEVREPAGDERVVADAIRAFLPESLAAHDCVEPLLDLAKEHPASRYLQLAQYWCLRDRMAKIGTGFDPDNPDDGWGITHEELRAFARDRLPEVALALETLSDTARQLTPDVLLELARVHELLGDLEAAEEVWSRIVREFPGRTAAEVAAEELADMLSLR